MTSNLLFVFLKPDKSHMKPSNWLIIIAILVCFGGCKEPKKESGPNPQMTSVMAQHDAMMLKMGAMGKLAAELKPKVDSTEQGREYARALAYIQDANESMMAWMQGFGDRFDPDEILNGKELNNQKKEWLREEAEKMEELTVKINSSIANAESLLGREPGK